jgi:hypothetical protein
MSLVMHRCASLSAALLLDVVALVVVVPLLPARVSVHSSTALALVLVLVLAVSMRKRKLT